MIEEIASRPSAHISGAKIATREAPPAAMRLSIHETTTYHWSLQDDVEGYCEAGIDAIGVWRPKLTQFGEERGTDLILDMGMKVTSLSWAGGFTGSYNCSLEESMDDARDAIELAGRLKANCLSVVSGTRAGHTTRHARRLVSDAIHELAEDAEKHNVLLALQPMSPAIGHQWSFVETLDETLEIIGASGVSCARIAFDVSHLFQEPRLLERIPEIAPLVAIVQLNDSRNQQKSEIDRCLPGDGEIPLAEITQAFLKSDYQGYFEIGVWSEDVWNADYLQVLKDCRSRYENLIRGC